MDLSALTDLRACVRAGPGLRWDFARGCAQRGRRWRRCSEDLRRALLADLEIQQLREAHSTAASEAKILCIVGPSGAGKSMIAPLAAEVFKLDLKSFAEVDGDQIRGCHPAWKRYVAEDQENGYLDAYEIYTSNKKNKGLKVQLLRELLEAGKNVIYGDTHVKDEDLELMRAKGYQVMAVGLMISCGESDCRQRNRAEANGRWSGTPASKWLATMQDVIKVCRAADQALIYDTTDVQTPRRVFVRHVDGLDDQDHWRGNFDRMKEDRTWKLEREGPAWCENLSLEGIYRKDDGGTVEIRVLEPEKEVTEVLVDTEKYHFSVRTCALHALSEDDFFVGAELAKFNVTSQSLHWRDGRTWCLEGKLPNSIWRAVREDPWLLDALRADGEIHDFCSRPFREMTEEEWHEALHACGGDVGGAQKALLVMAPSAGGKTTVVQRLAASFGLDLSSAVRADGAVFRDCHEQYRLVCENGVANEALWYNAWPSAKKVVQDAKKAVLHYAMERKQDIIISDTGAELKSLRQLIDELHVGGYTVSLLGIYADPKSILERGKAREISEGKRYNRSLKKLRATYQNFGAAIAMVDSSFKIVHNAQGREPEVVLEGTGLAGGKLPASLEEELARLLSDF